jgi:hypothetical protein
MCGAAAKSFSVSTLLPVAALIGLPTDAPEVVVHGHDTPLFLGDCDEVAGGIGGPGVYVPLTVIVPGVKTALAVRPSGPGVHMRTASVLLLRRLAFVKAFSQLLTDVRIVPVDGSTVP